ncbi:PP2C family protein-serine/threonine phosphatase [Streptomyces sp. NPDC059897]|uniref:PP2C family protein-serine/threonine phosphatase n=1 Tax=Streptomyces sp. NPDC059897 TaxID=3346994 RepID=UPI00366524AF
MSHSAGHSRPGQLTLHPVTVASGPLRLIARHISPVTGSGGDIFGVAPTADGVRLIIGDVMGHGAAAHGTAAAVLRAWRLLAPEEPALGGIAHRLHSLIARSPHPEQYVTAILGTIGTDARAELLCCGHPPPLVVRGSSAVFANVLTPALPLGLLDLADGRLTTHTMPFAPADRLLFYTDGVTEARSPLGLDFPLAESAASHPTEDPGSHLTRIESDLLRHTGGHLNDDALLLLLEHRRA